MPYGPVETFLEDAIGLDIESIGRKKLGAVIAARMREHGMRDAQQYCSLIARDAAAREHLIEEIVVPETWFFRDQGPFELLAQLCAEGDLACSQTQPLRILSLPCATGEEPYSIAMALVEAGLHPAWLAIDAVDISSRALEKARQAVFRGSSFRGYCGSWQQRYFSARGKDLQLEESIAQLVSFQQGNILGPAFPSGLAGQYAIIFCRNLLIYLSQEARRRVFERLDGLLAPGGYLFAGHTEVLLFQQFGYELLPQRACFACAKPHELAQKKKPVLSAACRSSAQQRRPPSPARPRVESRGRPQPLPARPQPEADMLAGVQELANRGELDRAAALCTEYLKGAGSLNARAHCLMGEILQARNDAGAAEQHFLRAVYLDPQCYDGLVHLSLLYELRGDRQKAQRYKRRASRLHG